MICQFHMFRIVGLVCAIFLAIAVLPSTEARATAPRINSLGGAGDYFEDEANVKSWYGSLVDYRDMATVDFGHFNIYYGYHDDHSRKISGPALTVHQDLGGQWGTLAAYLNTVGGDVSTGRIHRDNLDGTFSLMYARLVGPVQIGLHFQQGSREEAADWFPQIPTTRKSKQWEWGLGLRMDLSAGAYLDLVGDIRGTREELTADNDPGSPLSESLESSTNFSVRGRLFLRLGERTALVPVVEYNAENRPVQPMNIESFPGIDGHLFRLGCGLNFFPDTDRSFFAVAEWDNGSSEYSYTGEFGSQAPVWNHSWNTYSLLVGWESRFLPWMTLRSSAGYFISRWSQESLLDYDDLQFTLGTGFHLGDFDLDAALSGKEPFPFYGDWGLSYRGYRTTYISVAVRWMY